MKKSIIKGAVGALFCFFSGIISGAAGASAATEARDIFFPTDQTVAFRDDFNLNPPGRIHHANDLMGKKMMPLYAAVDGTVRDLEIPEASWGYAIILGDSEGYTYHYIHVNDDTPGTDDGLGGVDNAYAPFISVGALVHKGQLIGWMGDSGNAENVGAHLHFEIRRPDGTAIDPYASLIAARAGAAAPAPATPPASAPKAVKAKFVFKKDLKLGLTDSDVKQLQKFLNASGFKIAKTGSGSPGKETNYFGPATKAALIKFQKAKKISPAAGFFGSVTRGVANK